MGEYKVRIKFKSEFGIDSDEIYKTLIELSNIVPNQIYIEIEDHNGEVIGCGQAGEDAS